MGEGQVSPDRVCPRQLRLLLFAQIQVYATYLKGRNINAQVGDKMRQDTEAAAAHGKLVEEKREREKERREKAKTQQRKKSHGGVVQDHLK